MTLTQRQVPWGAASMLIKRYGMRASDMAVERLWALAMAGDEAGALMWKEIAGCIAQMSIVEMQS